MKTYFEKLQDPRWQRKRLEIMQRADFACEWCGDRANTLHVHHGYYAKGLEPWDYETNTLYCFCKNCHEKAENLRQAFYLQLARLHPKNHEASMLLLQHTSTFDNQAQSPKYREIETSIVSSVIIVGVSNGKITNDGNGHQEFLSLKYAKEVFPDIDPEKNTERFTWAMKEMQKDKVIRLRFETWAAYELYST